MLRYAVSDSSTAVDWGCGGSGVCRGRLLLDEVCLGDGSLDGLLFFCAQMFCDVGVQLRLSLLAICDLCKRE